MALFQLKIEDGLATLIFDTPGKEVNLFTTDALNELEKIANELSENPAIKVLIFKSAKKNVFIAGADLHGFEPAFQDPSLIGDIIYRGHHTFNKIQSLPFPTIALINGACMGGGLECALSFTYRIVTDNPKTLLALPEVSLGLIPGWGGTQRLPRLIGLQEGLNMILTGKPVEALKAYKIHLADSIVPWEFRDEKAEEFAKKILTEEGKEKVEQRRSQKRWESYLLESNPIGRELVFYWAKQEVLKKTKGHYPAPLIALNVIKKTYNLPLSEGLKIEADTFIANAQTGFVLSKKLIPLFFIQEAVKKETWVSSTPQEIHSAAVIGAGTMGGTISWLIADHNIPTRMKDISWDMLSKGLSNAKELFDKGLKAKKVPRYDYNRKLHLITGTLDYSGFQHADFIIEAATEDLELKRKIFKELEQVIKPTAVIASNTSSLTIAEMSEGMKHPERFVGMHFFNPVNKMPLVEVVPGPKTSPTTVATTVQFAKTLGKTPIVVSDCHGFLVNRILMAGVSEMLAMLEEGYEQEKIEKALLDYGMPMGPFLLMDEVGNDVTYKVSKTFEKGYGSRFRHSKLLEAMIEKRLFGQKTKKGFYLYNGTPKINPEIKVLLKSLGFSKSKDLPDSEIVPRFLKAMQKEAKRCLDEKIITNPKYLDLALVLGIGFPPFRGGILNYN